MSKRKLIQKPTWEDNIDSVLAEQIKSFVELLKCLEEPDQENSEVFSERIKDSSIRSFKIFYEGKQDINLIVDFFTSMKNVDVSDIEDDKAKQENFLSEFEQRMTPEMILFIAFQSLNLVSTLIDKKPLQTLYEEAKNGNEKSLLTLLKYDKTLFDHEWFKDLILKETMLGHSIFIEKLGDAIKSEPHITKHGQGKLKFIILIFWEAVFSKLTYKQQMEFLDWIGVKVPFSYDTYKKTITRKIKPLLKKNQ
jgi:hypothetical protein